MKIPVEVDDMQGKEDTTSVEEPVEADWEPVEGDGAAQKQAEPTEEELIEAAIRAGEAAADSDFKAKAEQVSKELSEVRKELEAASEAQAAAEAKAKDAVERQQRLQADWENYRRRTAQERLDERARATEKLVTSLLPVMDDIERALAHAESKEMGEDLKQFVDGVDAVRVKLMGVLEREGVEAIDPAGEAFDPNVHQAVGRVADAERYDETVNDVYQKGYRMGGKVLRPAMVTVTYGGEKRPAPEPDADAGASEPEGSKK